MTRLAGGRNGCFPPAALQRHRPFTQGPPVKRIGQRPQRTLARPASLQGTGFLTGSRVRITFRPAPPDTGLVFERTDARKPVILPAHWEQVTGTNRRTTLGPKDGQVGLVEHVLAALAGLRIDNCLIELNCSEPPGFDGSASALVEALQNAGATIQSSPRAIWSVTDPVTVSEGFATLTLHPAATDELRISYFLDYGHDSYIPSQKYSQTITPQIFAGEIANCRTFVLDFEAEQLQRQGMGLHVTPADILVFGPQGPINNRLRYADEPARHKVLDLIGDAALFGMDLRGHLIGCRSGHPLNVELIRTLARRLEEREPAYSIRVA